MKLNDFAPENSSRITVEQAKKAEGILIEAMLKVGINSELSKKLDWVFSLLNTSRPTRTTSKVIEFDKECTTALAEKMLSLYAQYVEGCIDSSGVEYNKRLSELSLKDVLYMIYRSPFDSHAIQMYDKLTTIVPEENLPADVRIKVELDRVSRKKMDELMKRN
jgi:hypothetical protein